MSGICTICGAENGDAANFCKGCGEKLKDFCDCWVKKEPYNCGQTLCPGYSLLLKEVQGNGGLQFLTYRHQGESGFC